MTFSSFFSATILQYKQLKVEFTFLMNLIMKSKKSKVLYYGQAVCLLSRFYLLHFLQSVIRIYNHLWFDKRRNWSQWNMFLKKIGLWRLSGSGNKLYWVCFINIFDLSINIGFCYIKLQSIHGNSSKSFFILVWRFPIYVWIFLFCGYTYYIKCNDGQKELTDITNWFIAKNIC